MPDQVIDGSDDVLYEATDGIGWITFNRPDRMNAFSPALLAGTWQVLERTKHDPAVRVIVITGAGDRAFCAGGDVKGMQQKLDADRTEYTALAGHDAVVRRALTLSEYPKPVIASLNGVAAGAGFELALQADFRIAADHARLKPAALGIGLVPGNASVFYLPRLVGLAAATEIIMTERAIYAEDARKLGLVNQVVPLTELRQATAAFAAELAAKPPLAMALTKRALRLGLTRDLEVVMEYLLLAVQRTRGTEDHKEGVRAFKEKRQPMFEGR
jgi:2-(1,2-epoxy-1,2-dihydrophenyl)acetyl-CoA isomerase